MNTNDHPRKHIREEARAVRIAGFTDSVSMYSPAKQEQMLKDYLRRDERREECIKKFLVLWGKTTEEM